MVINFMEKYVEEQLLRFLNTQSEYSDMCKYQDCIDGIMAEVLNNVAPVYYTSLEGQVFTTYAQREIQNKNDVITHLTMAVENAKHNNPHNQK